MKQPYLHGIRQSMIGTSPCCHIACCRIVRLHIQLTSSPHGLSSPLRSHCGSATDRISRSILRSMQRTRAEPNMDGAANARSSRLSWTRTTQVLIILLIHSYTRHYRGSTLPTLPSWHGVAVDQTRPGQSKPRYCA